MNKHTVNAIRHKQFFRQGLEFLTFAASTVFIHAAVLFMLTGAKPAAAQRITRNGVEIMHQNRLSVELDFNLDDYSLLPLGNGHTLLSSPVANSFSREAGMPQLPLYQQIVLVPDGTVPSVFVGDEEWETVTVTKGTLCPANGAHPKESVVAVQPIDSNTYRNDSAYGFPLAKLTPVGTMRGYRVMRLTIAPFRYNPARNTLNVCRHATVSLSVPKAGNGSKTISHQFLSGMGLNGYLALGFAESKDYANVVGSESAARLMIVAPLRFRKTLQPFISWKRQEGYTVDAMFVDNANNHAIKELLQQRYDQFGSDETVPVYVLLAGDVGDIPTWPARQYIEGIDIHSTDMPYVEFTGDSLPDALLGRIPANDTAELNSIIAKTLAYEKGLFDDTAYLHRSLLVAGTEERDPAPIVTNGQVNYLKELLMRIDPLHDTTCYHNPGSDTLVNEIYSNLRQGNALVNYTAHCRAAGWRNPTVTTDMIDTLPEDGKPFLAINNCCRSNAFSGDCFGEHLLRKRHGGAIGAIGATNETLWEEDYYWSVGNREALERNPQYQADGCGAFDRLFHTHGESHEQWAMTQSQIVAAGNWAVIRSGSPYWAFYWEIYCLLGDPTLMPFIGVPTDGMLTIGELQRGDMSVNLHGTPYARVAATRGDTLAGFCVLDSEGNGTMECSEPMEGNILFTSTAQYHKPVQRMVALGTLSIPDAQETQAEIYPNPARAQFTVSGVETQEAITLYDIQGHKVKEFPPSHSQTARFDISDLNSGVYYVVFKHGERSVVKKLTIAR